MISKIFTNDSEVRDYAISKNISVDSFSVEDSLLSGISGIYIFKVDGGMLVKMDSLEEVKKELK